MRLAYHVMAAPAPIGLLLLARSERGLRHLAFMNQKSLKRVQADLAALSPGATWEHSISELKPITDQLDEYFDGTRRRFDIELDMVGSMFQLQVWSALRKIPYGVTRAYGEIAKLLGQPGAARAVGLANNQNPVPIVVPCHRVIGADGKLVGYGGGVARKKHLLELERRGAKLAPLDANRVIEEAHVIVRRPAAAPPRKKVAGKRLARKPPLAAAGARRPR